MASNEIRRGAAEMSIAMLMSGSIGWLVVSSQQSTENVVFFRCLFGAATMAIVCAVLGLFRRKLFSWRMIGLTALCSVAIVGNWLLLFAAYSRASISIVAWLLVAFVGLVLVVKVEPAVLAVPGKYLEGVAYAVGAAFLYAVSSIVTKRLKGTPPHLIALIQAALGVLMLLPFAHFDALPTSAAQWLKLATLGIVNTGVMYVLLYGAIQKLPTAMTGALSFIYPVVAIIVDRVAFGQKLAWVQVLGAMLILLAAAGVNLGWRIVPQKRLSSAC
jgi:drug/metabolite transporter (DMT)-like permease